LAWSAVPRGSLSVALIMEDTDASFIHWAFDGLNPATTSLAAGEAVPAAQATNDFHRVGYGGPCPPPGSLHHYRLTLLALGGGVHDPMGLKASTMRDHIRASSVLAQGTLTGTYQRT